jgi:dCMP deaminase
MTYSPRKRVNNEEKSWDKYYYNICIDAAELSKCWSRQIGAILVRDKCIVATGFNAPPRGITDCGHRSDLDPKFVKERTCPRKSMGFTSGKGLEYCTAAHAEENAILMCARLGIEAKGTTMYVCCGIPCNFCMVKIINVGIENLVCTSMELYHETSQFLLDESGINVRLYDFLQ